MEFLISIGYILANEFLPFKTDVSLIHIFTPTECFNTKHVLYTEAVFRKCSDKKCSKRFRRIAGYKPAALLKENSYAAVLL